MIDYNLAFFIFCSVIICSSKKDRVSDLDIKVEGHWMMDVDVNVSIIWGIVSLTHEIALIEMASTSIFNSSARLTNIAMASAFQWF